MPSSSPGSSWHGTRAGRPHSSEIELATAADIDEYLIAKTLTSAKRSPLDLLKPLDGEALLGELLFIIRPVIYGMSMQTVDI